MIMGFESPLALLGLAAVGIPIAIHILNTLRVRHVKWAAMRFLQKAAQKNERRVRIEDRLLLFIRCLLVALLVLAFAAPVLNPEGSEKNVSGASGTTVIVLDQSASMAVNDGVRTRLDSAKELAIAYLDTLPPGTNVALLSADSKIAALDAAPGTDLGRIRRRIESAVPSASGNDWPSVLRRAVDALKPFEGVERSVVVFTDNQASAWKRREEVKNLFDANPSVALRVVMVGGDFAGNVGITSLKPDAGIIRTESSASYLVEVRNFGNSPAENIRVTLELNGESPADEKLIPQLAAGASESVRLALRIPHSGFQTATARISPDRFPSDDQRSIAFHVVSEMRVAIIADSPNDPGVPFLSNALVPLTPSRNDRHYLKVRFHPPQWLAEGNLEGENAIILLNPGRISREWASALQKYVEKGGALLVFPGDSSDPVALESDLGGMLPVKLGISRDQTMGWQADSYIHPVTSLWNGSPDNSLGGVIEQKNFPLEARDSSVRSIVDYANGSPAVVEGGFGDGRVVVFAAPPNARWTNLPLHPNFVPFLQRLMAEVMQARGNSRFLSEPGAAFQVPMKTTAVGRKIVVEAPGASLSKPAGQILASGNGGICRFLETHSPGAYRLFFEGATQPFMAFAVQVPAEESELAPLEVGDLQFVEKIKTTSIGADAPELAQRIDLFALLLWMIFALAILELLMAHRFSISK